MAAKWLSRIFKKMLYLVIFNTLNSFDFVRKVYLMFTSS